MYNQYQYIQYVQFSEEISITFKGKRLKAKMNCSEENRNNVSALSSNKNVY